MRNIRLFLIRYHVFFLFLIFESGAVCLLVNYNNYQKSIIGSAANRLVSELYQAASKISQYFYLEAINEHLVAENTQLKNQLAQRQSSNLDENNCAEGSTDQSFSVPARYTYLNAKVVNNTVTARNNYLVLDRGAKDGIQSGMGVVSSNSIIGVVKDVSPNFCTVMSLLHKEAKVSAQLEKGKEIGSLIWPGKDIKEARLTQLPNHVKIVPMDWVITTGYSLFPAGLRIGQVTAIDTENGLLSATVQLLTKFEKLSAVYIVKDSLAAEKKALEANLIEYAN